MSDEKDDGGPAFPTPGKAFEFTGLTIRDYFAAKALAQIDIMNLNNGATAQYAYEIADAMIQERSK